MSQTILPRIIFISSNEKARSVWERTLPREETLKESAGRDLVVRRLEDRNKTPLFFAISLKASARPIVSLTLRTP